MYRNFGPRRILILNQNSETKNILKKKIKIKIVNLENMLYIERKH